jgi:xanthine dehydrogenase accessory factor
MDIFVEPVPPRPQIVVCGCSPVGVAVAELVRQFGFFVIVRAPASDHAAFGEVDLLADGFEPQNVNDGSGFISSRPKARGIARRSKRRSKHPRLRFHSSARAKKAEALRKELAELVSTPDDSAPSRLPPGSI